MRTQRAARGSGGAMGGRSGRWGRWLGIVPFAMVGCGPGDLPGHYFEVSTAGVENLCTGDGTGYAEDYEFRLEVSGNDATVSVGDALFATGTLQGCSLSYSSIVWSDLREGLEIEWQILGSARVDLSGGDGCVGGSVDWEGTETFVVTTSAHPDVEPGCTYTLGVSGSWIEDVGIEDGTPATTSEAP